MIWGCFEIPIWKRFGSKSRNKNGSENQMQNVSKKGAASSTGKTVRGAVDPLKDKNSRLQRRVVRFRRVVTAGSRLAENMSEKSGMQPTYQIRRVQDTSLYICVYILIIYIYIYIYICVCVKFNICRFVCKCMANTHMHII